MISLFQIGLCQKNCKYLTFADIDFQPAWRVPVIALTDHCPKLVNLNQPTSLFS